MASSDQISEQRQRLSEWLARLDADRAKLAQELQELEIAERVLSRFGTAPPAPRRERQTTTTPDVSKPQLRSAKPANVLSLGVAALQAVAAHGDGATAAEVMTYLTRELGMSVRPNHLGAVLQRHRRAGRLENRDQRWFLPQSAQTDGRSATDG